MDYSFFFDFLTLVGALGMFLYGMKVMSEGLQKVAGDKLRSILSVMTTNRFTGVLTDSDYSTHPVIQCHYRDGCQFR